MFKTNLQKTKIQSYFQISTLHDWKIIYKSKRLYQLILVIEPTNFKNIQIILNICNFFVVIIHVYTPSKDLVDGCNQFIKIVVIVRNMELITFLRHHTKEIIIHTNQFLQHASIMVTPLPWTSGKYPISVCLNKKELGKRVNIINFEAMYLNF